MFEIEFRHHSIISDKFGTEVFLRLQELDLYYHSIVGDQYRGELF